MSKIQVNEIVNHFDTGAPDCPKGLTVTGFSTFTGGASYSGDVSIGGTLTYEDVTNIDSVGIITAQSGVHYGIVGSGVTIDAVGAGTSLGFLINGSERVRIDSSGRLLVGTSTSRNDFFNTTNSCAVQIEKAGTFATSTVASLSIVNNEPATNASAPYIVLGRTLGSSVGSTTAISGSSFSMGRISFQGADGSELVESALIEAFTDAAPGANDMPGRLVFSTTANNESSPTERMRIGSDGKILLGTTTATNTSNSGVTFSPSTNNRTLLDCGTTNTASAQLQRFFNGNGQVGNISTSGSATVYNTSSDYRLKENIAPVTDGITRLQQLKPSRFNFIADPDTVVDGFIAHEAAKVVPECVTGTKDEVDDDGKPVYQGIDQSKLVPLLTAALQEAIAKIETQGAAIAALEAKVAVLEGN